MEKLSKDDLNVAIETFARWYGIEIQMGLDGIYHGKSDMVAYFQISISLVRKNVSVITYLCKMPTYFHESEYDQMAKDGEYIRNMAMFAAELTKTLKCYEIETDQF